MDNCYRCKAVKTVKNGLILNQIWDCNQTFIISIAVFKKD